MKCSLLDIVGIKWPLQSWTYSRDGYMHETALEAVRILGWMREELMRLHPELKSF